MRTRYAANREKLVAESKAWVQQNPEKVREYARIRRAKNAEKIRVDHKRWRDANPDKVKASYHRNQAKRANVALEEVAERYLHDTVKLVGGMCQKFVDPSRRGAPDRLVMLPGKPVVFVEMKRALFGRLQPWQERYHADLRALGHRVAVLWSKEDVDEFLASI